MSTYVYLECLDHNPPLKSDDEVGQHLYDLPRIQADIARRDLYVANSLANDYCVDYGDYFTNVAARFLVRHRFCRIGIRDEYGTEHPIMEIDKPT